MKAQLKEKLTTLTSLIGVSGNEHHVIRYCKDYLEPLADEVTVLPCGDLIARFISELQDSEDDPVRRNALYYGLNALLDSN